MTVRVGIIGCGAISESHLTALRDHPEADIIACADVDRGAAQRRADPFGIPHVFSDTDPLLALDDVDLVVICVPPKWHAEIFGKAVASGKHVLIEKPLAMDLAEADRMVDLATHLRRIIGVALVHRYLPAYQVLRDLIQGGAIGEVRLVRVAFGRNMYEDPRFTQPDADPRGWLVDRSIAGGGILMSSSIHFLSAVSFVLGNPAARRVTARVRRVSPKAFPGIEDEVDLWIELEDGVDFVLRESWVSDVAYRAEFVGERGQLVATGPNWQDPMIEGTCESPIPEPYRPCLDGARFCANPPELTAPVRPLFGGLMADLLASIEQGTRTPRLPGLIHARNLQAVIAAAYRSEQTGEGHAIDWRADS